MVMHCCGLLWLVYGLLEIVMDFSQIPQQSYYFSCQADRERVKAATMKEMTGKDNADCL